MDKTEPLFSICLPVFNGASMIHRALESCINQTYKNIEIIVSDNASTDNTQEIVLAYAAKDKRIKYFRNETNIGPVKNFFRVFELASGEFAQLLAHDDWLSQNYAEEAVRLFALYPETAAIFTKHAGFFLRDDKFYFQHEITYPSKNYPVSYLVKMWYKDMLGAFGMNATFRREEALKAMDFTAKLFFEGEGLPDDMNDELKRLHKEGWGIDMVMPLKIMADHPYFTFTDKSVYVGLNHSHNSGKQMELGNNRKSAAAIIKAYVFQRICLEHTYAREWREYLSGMRIFIGTDLINTIIIQFIKNRFPSSYFKNLRVKNFRDFFESYTIQEKMGVIAFTVPVFIKRIAKFLIRKSRKVKPLTTYDYDMVYNGCAPLVSICIPVYNGASMIHRALESCINQTYKNIEIIVSDNASTDNTQEIVLAYAAKDKRIKYFRNETNIGAVYNFLKSFEYTSGYFLQLLGYDDWLSRNYIEEGLKKFELYPDTACVYAKTVDCKIMDNGKFFFQREISFKPKNYSVNFVVKNFSRSDFGSMGPVTFCRKKDMRESLKYFTDNTYPETIMDFVDNLAFIKMLSRYKYLTFADTMAYIKTTHHANMAKSEMIKFTDAKSILEFYYNWKTNMEYAYVGIFKKYLRSLKIGIALEVVTTIVFNYAKNKFSNKYFKNNYKIAAQFFKEYVLLDKIEIILLAPYFFLRRVLKLIIRKTTGEQKVYFSANYFLNKKEEFEV